MTTAIKKNRNSETRNKIFEFLRGTKEHPSADTIYRALRPSIPTLSLGTVYTNLKLFEEQGLAIRVANVNGNERYDANTTDHVHLVCDCCGAVIDIMDANMDAAKTACSVSNARINKIKIVLHGVCDQCFDKS